MSHDALHIIFTAIVLNVITYALPSFAGQLSVGDKAHLDIFGKLLVRGFCCQTFSIDELTSAGDKTLFRKMSDVRHCLHALLPKQRHNKILNSLRSHGHNTFCYRLN